jgi:tRNA pseudouridine32 synthase/23S rRNA pseudouridine746 synthase
MLATLNGIRSQVDFIFHQFKADISHIDLPEKFTFPFNYIPHPLSNIAMAELQDFIKENVEPTYSFGMNNSDGFGKMFGVLVVKNLENKLGFLAAFSGKLFDRNEWNGFVPPVYDMLTEEGFFKKGEIEIHQVTNAIEAIEVSSELQVLKYELSILIRDSIAEIESLKTLKSEAKIRRLHLRQENQAILSAEDFVAFEKTLDNESQHFHYEIKRLRTEWKLRIETKQRNIDIYLEQIQALKQKRKSMSKALQDRLFDSYVFSDANGQRKSLLEIFQISNGDIPPSGAGECAAPKLLEFAFQNQYTPIAMAEFWYGKSPNSEIRKHKIVYPSCRSKCLPILSHMLQGLDVEENRMLIRLAENKELEIIYEDEDLLIINKPHHFLSVPGGQIQDSVYQRVKEMYPLASGPLIVHRLDMSTSGLLIIALNKKAHYHIQRQFESKTIQKRYVAVLDGKVAENSGEINLPIRVDLEDRPRQLVDYEYGKPAHTLWEKISETETETRVYFYPISGRTHQLRVHSSHPLGLNIPIKGDDLYGTRSDRMYLHAERIEFNHPTTNERIVFEKAAGF